MHDINGNKPYWIKVSQVKQQTPYLFSSSFWLVFHDYSGLADDISLRCEQKHCNDVDEVKKAKTKQPGGMEGNSFTHLLHPNLTACERKPQIFLVAGMSEIKEFIDSE